MHSYSPKRPSPQQKAAFTLVELLVAIAILAFVMALVLSMTQQTSVIWKKTTGKIEGLRDARVAFESMTRTLSQATLNTYYDYFDAAGNGASSGSYSGTPATYGRQSNLEFYSDQGATLLPTLPSHAGTPYKAVTHSVFFQAPLGVVNSGDASPTSTSGMGAMNGLLNACGFYVVYGPDPQLPGFLPTNYRYRYRLMEFVQPSESLSIYTTGNWNSTNWFFPAIQTDLQAQSQTADYVLAENVIALIILPKLSAKDEAIQAPAVAAAAPGTALVGTTSFLYNSATLGQFQSTANAYLNSKNQLPPIVQVTMVAIDEASAIKLGNTTTPPDAKLGLSTLFSAPPNLQADLNTLEATLIGLHLNYRVFQTDVALRSAKWTVSK